MLTFVVRRLFQGLLILLGVIWFTFSLTYFQVHGAKAPAWIVCGTHVTPACLNGVIAKYHLGQPYFVRLWSYVEGVFVHGNLGTTFKQQIPSVSENLIVLVPRTLWVTLVSLVLSTLIALPIGVRQARKRNSKFDYAATGVGFVLYTIPSFVLGMILLDVFAFGHPWRLFPMPPSGVDTWAFFTQPKGFILPVATLTLVSVAGLTRFMRSSVLDVLVSDHIRTARAKGCTPRQVMRRHVYRNAMGTVVVILGLSLGGLFSGALVVEYLFNYEGLGLMTINAAGTQDIYLVMGGTILVTAATVIGNILADIGLAVLNPQIRLEGKK
jgi:peptide/nickel transport system permease protein